MAARGRSRSTAAVAIACALSTAILAVTAAGHPAAANEEASLLAWLGCWQLEDAREDADAEPKEDSRLLCVEPGDSPSSLTLRAIAASEVVADDVLVADGSRRPVDEGGCSGWKRSMLSADGRRIYLEAETTCEGGNPSNLSGASLIVSGGRWVDINLTRVGSKRELVVRHYRRADVEPAAGQPEGGPVYSIHLPGTLPTSGDTARVVAAVPLEEEDVIEALGHLDPAVVEAMLVASDSSFKMDARLLVRLDDAGVPGQIIDLMMALSYPAYFAIEDESVVMRAVDYTDNSRSWGAWPYGRGYWYGDWYTYRHHHDDSHSRPKQRAVAIKGGGYKKVRPTRMPTGGVTMPRLGGASSSSGTGGTGGNIGAPPVATSGSGNQGSSSDSQRRAVPR